MLITQHPEYMIFSLTVNNLYGGAMSQPVPVGEYVFLKKNQIQQIDWLTQGDNQVYGYILEVDLEYPSHLHKHHNSFPLAPQHMGVEKEQLSPYAQSTYTTYVYHTYTYIHLYVHRAAYAHSCVRTACSVRTFMRTPCSIRTFIHTYMF